MGLVSLIKRGRGENNKQVAICQPERRAPSIMILDFPASREEMSISEKGISVL